MLAKKLVAKELPVGRMSLEPCPSSLLAFIYIAHTGHVNSVTWNTYEVNRHCLHLRQESAIIYIWWCLRHFSLSPLRLLWSWGKSCLFVSGSVGLQSLFQNWEHEASKCPTLEEVGYPHEPTFSDRQPRLPLHRQYASDLRRVCINKTKGFRWNPFTGPSTRALAGTEGKEEIS